MYNITRFALDNSRVTLFAILMVALAGLMAFPDYPKQEDPSVTIRKAIVTAHYPGMPTRRVENLLTRKLEEKIREIPEVDHIKSISKPGTSLVHVVVRDDVDEMEPVWQNLRNRMADLAPDLPEGAVGPLVNDEFDLTAVATIALWSDGFTLAEMRQNARSLRDQLYALNGTKRVELFGIQEERIYLEANNTRLRELGVTPSIIRSTLQSQNVLLSGGRFRVDEREFLIEPSGNINSVEQLHDIEIPIPGSELAIPLQDLVKIRRAYVDPPEKPAYFNGRQAIVLSVSILEGTDAVEFGERLKTRVAEAEQSLPIGYVLEFATFQPALIDKAVFGAISNLMQTVIIVLAVVMLFLGLRTGLVVGAFVPLVMLIGLAIMAMLGVELQRISIASMILALGLLVDNGIVVAEDIRSRLERGEERREAVISAGRSLAVPLLTSTLTTVLAFMPLMLSIGGSGEYTGSLSVVVTILLLTSWFLSLTATTTVSYHFLKVKPKADNQTKNDPYNGWLFRAYRSFLHWVLHNRGITLALVIIALLTSLWGMQFVVKEFFPPSDRNQYLIYLDLPAGSDVRETSEAIQSLSDWLGDKTANPEVTDTIGYAGSGGPRFFLSLAPIDPDPHVGFLVVNTQTPNQVPEMVVRTRQHILENFPNVRGRVKSMWLGPNETGLLEVRISGDNDRILMEKAEQLLSALRDIPGTVDIMQDWDNPIVKLMVQVDQIRAQRVGLTSADVAKSLQTFLSGQVVTDYREGDTIIPVIARGSEKDRSLLSNLGSIGIFSESQSSNVPLGQIANIVGVGEYSRLKRRDQARTITVSAKHATLKAADLFSRLKPSVEGLELPPGYFWELGGELEASAKAQKYLAEWMPAAVGLIVLLLIWQFNSFRRALIILLTIPLIMIGAVPGLLIMKAVFGFMTILGLLSLAGTIINNAIVLIDRIESERTAGTPDYEAVVNASVARLRPIFMSVGTTVLGLMPLIWSKDALFYGMASEIVFGLAIGTVLTLGIVPVLYALFMRIRPPM
ncbi:MAG: efflux RND transporter permease subunit [Candidatus Sedimenticola sp. (ex Thyasira tokunagai)]